MKCATKNRRPGFSSEHKIRKNFTGRSNMSYASAIISCTLISVCSSLWWIYVRNIKMRWGRHLASLIQASMGVPHQSFSIKLIFLWMRLNRYSRVRNRRAQYPQQAPGFRPRRVLPNASQWQHFHNPSVALPIVSSHQPTSIPTFSPRVQQEKVSGWYGWYARIERYQH